MLIVSANLFIKNFNFLLQLIKIIVIFLIFRFSTDSLLRFYIFFEASLIPIFLIIIIMGYQPERLIARIIILFYTLTSSFPLLATLLIILQKNFYLGSLSALRLAYFERR
ncbi:MAG: hypothetical protein K2P99_02735 [Burkholderiales bacterium]|nr:hypothetical protein [Burkholderiales bacterium]